MGDMIEVAKATVTIIPNMQGAQQTIAEQLGAASDSAGAAASQAAGSSFVGGLGGQLSGLGGVMSAALPAAAVAGVGKALFDVGSQFDEMEDIIITGTGASGEALESLKQAAMDIGTTAPVSFQDSANIVQDLNTRLGLTGDTLTEVGTQVAQLGDLTGEAFDTEKFSGAMSVWGTSAEDMAGQLDYMFAVSQNTGLGMNDLTGIMENAGPSMQTLGYSFEETAAMAGLLDKAGLDAGSTMGKMSKALVEMAKEGEEPADAMQRITEEIGGYIDSGDEAAALDLASQLFGTKGAAQFVEAVKSGSMEVEDFAAAMSDSAGIIGETQEQTMSFGERVNLLKNQFMEMLEPIGSEIFTGLSEVMATISEAFGNFVEGPGQKIGEVFSAIVDGASGLGQIFMDAFSDTTGISTFGEAVSSVGGTVQGFLNAIKPVTDTLGNLLRAILPPLARFLGGQLGSAFKGIQGIVNGVSSVFNRFKSTITTVRNAFSNFKNAVTAPFNFLGNLKIPHISISGGELPYGIGGLGVKPSISVTWGAKGGILDGATLIGAGEAGKEALLPLERNTEWMDKLADKIDSGNNFYVTLNATASESPEEYADRFYREMKRVVRMGM